jgi:DNA-directed RNA polymerase specialized sigma24 family protein
MAETFNAGAPGPSDADLIRAIAADDRGAFAALFDRYAVRIKAFMLRAGASEQDADEIAQDVMVSVWRRAAASIPRARRPRPGSSRSRATGGST